VSERSPVKLAREFDPFFPAFSQWDDLPVTILHRSENCLARVDPCQSIPWKWLVRTKFSWNISGRSDFETETL